MNERIEHIVVVGGGSAGWITAGLIAADHSCRSSAGVRVTLIESPDVATIGVGEGTWPSMRETLRRIGLSEAEFIAGCDASFKQGSKFIGWKDGAPGDQYYHPFMLPEGYFEFSVGDAWLTLDTKRAFADVVSAQPPLCERGRAPKQASTPDYEGIMNYGYHLNAGLFSELLKKHCVTKLGVSYIKDHVIAINEAANGDIASLSTKQNGLLSGDLFIDCSGMKALLLGEHYGIPFVSKKDVLFNDRALAVQVPYPQADAPIASATLSTAQEVGWIWDIGLPSRRGVGYVYSGAYCEDMAAEEALRRYLAQSLPPQTLSLIEPRSITFEPGHRAKFWHRNCVAVGMSSGFLEPLEASALALVELSAKMISDELPMTRKTMAVVENRFNERFQYRWSRIIDFLKLHYVLSKRSSSYWMDNKNDVSIEDSLSSMLEVWGLRPPSRNDFFHYDEVFPAASYLYVLYGMGFRSAGVDGARAGKEAARARAQFENTQKMIDGYLKILPDNRALIEQIGAFVRRAG